MPDVYFGADATYLQYIQDFVTENKNKVMKRKVHPEHGVETFLVALFGDYMNKYTQPGQPDPKTGQPVPGIVQANEQRKVQKMQRQQAQASMMQGADAGKDSSANKPGAKGLTSVGHGGMPMVA